MSVVCSGTTSRPTTITNRTFRPGKVIQAKAYAANAATRTGMIVAGIVMNRLLMNAGPMLLSAEDVGVVVEGELARREDRGPPARVVDRRPRAGTS